MDVEGFEFEVLQSNDWDRYQPLCVLVECLAAGLDTLAADPVCTFLAARGYRPFAKTLRTVLFRRDAPAQASGPAAPQPAPDSAR